MKLPRILPVATLGAAFALLAFVPVRVGVAGPSTGRDPMALIREEGMQRSQVMQTVGYLTDIIGPRLTNSPQMRRANEWTRDRLASWGLQNAQLEAWGPFGRGWSLQRFSAQVVEPQAIPLIAYPKAWSPGLRREVVAPVVYLDARNADELERFRGRLKGAIVLNGAARPVAARFDPLATRYSDQQLADLQAGRTPSRPGTGTPPGGTPSGPGNRGPSFREQLEFNARKLRFLVEERAAVLVDASTRGDGGTLFVQSAQVPTDPNLSQSQRPSAWSPNPPATVPQIVMTVEHYNRLVRMLQQGEKVRMAVDLRVRFHDEELMAHNTLADIPGTDRADELVMLGGHLDSWHGGTGATDNASGVAVAMEAVRILQATGLRPRRTVRIALWSGEEQGLHGSRAHVEKHFGVFEPRNPQPGQARTLVKRPGWEKLSAYYNLDNGTGKIRGIYLQGNEALRPLFTSWLTPFHDLGAATVTSRPTGSTDHIPFDGIGLPGFQFIQDPVEYSTRTHHSNMDVYDRLQADDLKQASVVMAAFVYQTAMRDERLPRKPVTIPSPGRAE